MSGYGDVPPPPPGPPSGPPAGPPPQGPPQGPSPQGPPQGPAPGGPAPGGVPPQRSGRGWIIALVVGLVALVAVVAVLVVLLVTDDDGDDDGGKGGSGSASASGGSDGSEGAAGTEEEQVEQVIVEAMTRWSEAERGDESACTDLDDLIEAESDGDVEKQCLEEVGSHSESTLESVEVDDIELSGDQGTAQVRFVGTQDGNEDNNVTRKMNVVKVDGRWKVRFD